MKKLFFIFATVLVLVSCATRQKTSTYVPPKNPVVPFTTKQLSMIDDYQKLIGVGVSFSKAFTLIEGNGAGNKKEEISENGILNIFDIFSGYKLNIPKKIPVVYQSGPLKGQRVLLGGRKYLYQEMTGVISDVLVEGGELIQVSVTIYSQDRQDELIFSLKEYKNTERFFLKKKKKDSSFSSEEINDLGLGTDQYGNVVLKQSSYHYLLESNNENLWFVNKADRAVYLENFFLNHQMVNQVKEGQAVPIIVGSEKLLKKK